MIDPNDFEEEPTTREPLAHPNAARFAANSHALERAAWEIANLKTAADDVAARLKRLDDEANSPARVRRNTLREVSEMLYATGELSASKLVMDVIRKEI